MEYIGSLVVAVAVQVMVERWEEVAVLDLLHMLVLDLVLAGCLQMSGLPFSWVSSHSIASRRSPSVDTLALQMLTRCAARLDFWGLQVFKPDVLRAARLQVLKRMCLKATLAPSARPWHASWRDPTSQ